MAPLMCADVFDLYGSNFGKSVDEIVNEKEKLLSEQFKKNNECADKNSRYQESIKNEEISGEINNNNEMKFAKRLAWTDKNNKWPSNQGMTFYNRFQRLFGERDYLNDEDCINHLVSLVKEVLLVLKIIMLILILFFIIKILNKN